MGVGAYTKMGAYSGLYNNRINVNIFPARNFRNVSEYSSMAATYTQLQALPAEQSYVPLRYALAGTGLTS